MPLRPRAGLDFGYELVGSIDDIQSNIDVPPYSGHGYILAVYPSWRYIEIVKRSKKGTRRKSAEAKIWRYIEFGVIAKGGISRIVCSLWIILSYGTLKRHKYKNIIDSRYRS